MQRTSVCTLLFGAALMLSMSGCAPRVLTLDLQPVFLGNVQGPVGVFDARPDPLIYMTSISIGSATNTYILQPDPTVDTVLAASLNTVLADSLGADSLSVRIERLDLRNVVGFAKADQLTCTIESVVAGGSPGNERMIRTVSRNDENMSPLVTTAGALILQQCLTQHSREIALSVERSRYGESR
jgi:hypothetical protein